MRKLAAALTLVLGALPASCAFILDFDELQAGDDAGAGDGSAGSGGSPGGCPGGCDDNDPCTIDRCDTSGDKPTCVHESGGMIPDGFSYTTDADQVHRVTMTASGDKFYLSLFTTDNGARDVEFFSFGAGGDELVTGPKLSSIPLVSGLTAESAAGLVVDNNLAFRLYAYVALSAGLNPTAASVFEVVLSPDLNVRILESGRASMNANYQPGILTRYPKAFKPNDQAPVYAGWIGTDGNIYAHQAGTGQTSDTPLFNVGNPSEATAFALVGAGDTAGAFWVSDQPHIQLAGGPDQTIPTCDPMSAAFSASASRAWFPGSNAITWTAARDMFVGSQFVLAACDENNLTCGMLGDDSCQERERFTPFVRNAVGRIFQRPGDPAGRIWQAQVTPFIDLDDTEKPEAAIGFSVLRVDFDPVDVSKVVAVVSLTGDQPLELSRMPIAGEEGEGPDWPALAISGDSKIAIAWIEPKGAADQLRIERFRLCE